MLCQTLLSLALLAAASLPASGADLSKLPRTIARAPAWQSKSPRYCLLVFGPTAATRIWLAADGDRLFVDRNGNGDLTEAGEVVTAAKDDSGFLTFDVGELREADGKTRHTKLRVTLFGKDTGSGTVAVQAADRGEQIAGNDLAGALTFADKPAAAPVIHFNGPLRMALTSATPLQRSAKPVRLNAVVGTPGLGEGTFAAVSADDVPEGVHPRAEIEFRDAAGTKLAPARVAFDQHC